MNSPALPYPIASRYTPAPILRLEPLGQGLINDTYLVETNSSRWVLQRINPRVFPDPAAIMVNLRVLAAHLRRKQADSGLADLRLPALLVATDGTDCQRDEQGGFWRALEYMEGTRTLPALAEPSQAEQVGRALGRFHALTADLDVALLHDTLPGFHIAPGYLARYDRIRAGSLRVAGTPELVAAQEFVAARRPVFEVLETAKDQGRLRLRVIHGDPKLDNVLFDADGRLACSLIDLDTVKPGLVHYDLGDCLRSCCNRKGENAAGSGFDTGLCAAILRGYLAEARGFFTAADHAYLYDAIRLLPLELGLRFLTDHLEGDPYFKTRAPGQNLRRAAVQFQLVRSVEEQEEEIRRLVDRQGTGHGHQGDWQEVILSIRPIQTDYPEF